MSIRIRLKFPETGELLQNFLNSISQGNISIPVNKSYEPGQEIALDLTLPELAEVQTIRAKALKTDLGTKTLRAEIVDLGEVDRLFDRLRKIPAYHDLVKSADEPMISIEEEREPEGPEPEDQREAEVTIKLSAPEPEPEKPAPSVKPKPAGEEKITKPHEEPAAAKKPAPEKIAPEKPAEPEPAPPPKTPERSAEEPSPKEPAEGKAPASDLMGQLRGWLLIKDEKKEKKKAQDKAAEEKEEEKKKEEELDLEPASQFVQSLVKAMLRSGYYSPDHPGSADAKHGLFNEYKKAVGKKMEFGFMMQHRVAQTEEIFITGIIDDPIPLKKLLGAGTSELFFPKYMDYFMRKRLVSFSIKTEITKEHFNKFVDIMSDPNVDKGEAGESGRLLTRMLVENQINEISALFETDLIRLETNLPWRVEMAIQRLAKDLRVLPMFKNISKADLQRLKKQIIQDIQRPLRSPELLKDIVLNVYLISMQVKGINEEELEETIIENFPRSMILATADLVMKEYAKMQETKAATPEEEELLARRNRSAKRVLRKMAIRAIQIELDGADAFLEQLFSLKLLAFEELPEEVQEKVNNIRMADEFQKQPPYWLSKFAEARNKEELDLFLKYFSKVLPILIDRKDWQSLYLITDAFLRIPPNKLKIFAEMSVASPSGAIWEKQLTPLVQSLLTESEATRQGLEQILFLLGDTAMEATYQALLRESDSGRRKTLIQTLLQFGPKAMELFRGILQDPSKPANLQFLSLEALGRAKNKNDVDLVRRYLKHSRPELRCEAITALVRISGWETMNFILGLMSDPEPAVKKRLIATLGAFAGAQAEARSKLIDLALDNAAGGNERALALMHLGKNLPEAPEDRAKLQDEILDLVCGGEGLRGKLRRAFKVPQEELDRLKAASLDLLGKIGDETALKRLSKLSISGEGLQSRLEAALNQLQLRLGAK